jgi:hypothetical protein
MRRGLLDPGRRGRGPEEGGNDLPEVQPGTNNLKLDMKINTRKIEIARLVEQYGLNDDRVLKVSQRLDELIAEWYRMSA